MSKIDCDKCEKCDFIGEIERESDTWACSGIKSATDCSVCGRGHAASNMPFIFHTNRGVKGLDAFLSLRCKKCGATTRPMFCTSESELTEQHYIDVLELWDNGIY